MAGPPLTPLLVENFLNKVLLSGMSNPRPTPECHRVWWQMVCSEHEFVAIAAPRAHAKSSAITFAYGMACALFRHDPNIVIVSRTHDIAKEFIKSIKHTLLTNTVLQQAFHFNRLVTDTEDDFIADVGEDHYQFRMQSVGFGTAVRGLNWGTQRPTLILMDDCESDEQVMNQERRAKAMDWTLAALIPARDPVCGKVRAVGTFMHIDAMLVNLVEDPSWESMVFEAHNDDFSFILWPEMWSKEKLMKERYRYEGTNRLDLYNMEFRNRVVDTTSGYFRKDEFLPFEDFHRTHQFKSTLSWYAGGDFAWSLKQKTDYTVMPIVGVDSSNNMYVYFVKRGHMDGAEVVDEMFALQETFNPGVWFNERGAIANSLQAAIDMKQRATGTFINIQEMPATKEKRVRARPLQARMRAKAVYWDTEADWFPEVQLEFLQFDRGKHDDCVDALSHIAIGLSGEMLPMSEMERDDERYAEMKRETVRTGGRNARTGY
jgi:predicted phage terminase large subunit-like protein